MTDTDDVTLEIHTTDGQVFKQVAPKYRVQDIMVNILEHGFSNTFSNFTRTYSPYAIIYISRHTG